MESINVLLIYKLKLKENETNDDQEGNHGSEVGSWLQGQKGVMQWVGSVPAEFMFFKLNNA